MHLKTKWKKTQKTFGNGKQQSWGKTQKTPSWSGAHSRISPQVRVREKRQIGESEQSEYRVRLQSTETESEYRRVQITESEYRARARS